MTTLKWMVMFLLVLGLMFTLPVLTPVSLQQPTQVQTQTDEDPPAPSDACCEVELPCCKG